MTILGVEWKDSVKCQNKEISLFFVLVVSQWDKLHAFILPMVVKIEIKTEGISVFGSDRPVS